MKNSAFAPGDGAVQSRRKTVHALLAAAVLAWVVLVLAVYYRQLWRLLLGQGWDYIAASLGLSSPAHLVGPLLASALVFTVLAAVALAYWLPLARRNPRRAADLAFIALILVGGLGFLALTVVVARPTIDPSLPYLLPALGRQLLGLGGALALMTAAAALGLAISRGLGWHYASVQEGLPFAVALGIGALANLGLVLALAGLYRPYILQAVVTLVLLSALAAGAAHYLRRPTRLAVPSFPQGTTRLWLACSALAVFCAGLAALAPESQFDAVWYHLAYPQRYLAAGHLVDLKTDFVSLYPMTVGLWFGYGLALGGPTAAVLLHFALLPTVATATYALARRVAPRAAPWLAVALVVTVPTVIWEASTAYIDLAMMLFLTLALYALLRYLEAHRSQWLVLAALNLGFALASKHLALLAALLLGAGLFLALLRQGAGPRKAFGAFSVLAGISFLLVLPWYVRSYLATGDPVFQVLYPLLGAPPDRWDAMTEAGARRFLNHFGRPRTLPNLLTLPWDMTMHAANYGGTLGPLYLLFLPLLALRRLRGALLWIAVGAAAFVLLWASPVSSFQVRHLLPIVPLLAVLAAVAFARTAALARSVGGRHAPALLAVCTAALMVLNVPPFTILHQGDMDGWRGWFTSVLHKLPLGVVIGGEDEATYLARQIRSYVVWRFADQTLPSDARVLTWSSGEDLYTRLDRLWANSALGNDAAWAPAGKEEEAFALLHDLGITHLIVDIRPEDSPDPWDAYALTSPTVRHTWYEELYADDGYVLYRIRWETLRPDN